MSKREVAPIQPPPAWKTAGIFALFVTLSLAGGALVGWAIVASGLADGAMERFDFEAPKLLRRVQTIVAVLLAPWLMKRIGWRGWQDLGWKPKAEGPRPLPDLFRGFLLGLLLMGALIAVSLLVGNRAWDPKVGPSAIADVLMAFLLTGLAVGVLEETLARGALYRSLARTWGPVAAMVVTSGIFAYAHFLEATPEAIAQGPLETVRSSLMDGLVVDRVLLQLLNLSLLSVLLCVMVHKRGDIWMAVGFHAAAVGLIKSNGVLLDRVHQWQPTLWFGTKRDYVDGALCTLLLLLVIVWASLAWRKIGSRSEITTKV